MLGRNQLRLVLHEGCADRRFEQQLSQAIKNTKLPDASLFTRWDRILFKHIAKKGRDEILNAMLDLPELAQYRILKELTKIGLLGLTRVEEVEENRCKGCMQEFFRSKISTFGYLIEMYPEYRIASHLERRLSGDHWFPFHDFLIVATVGEFHVIPSSFIRTHVEGSTVWCPPNIPVVAINGENYRVSFSSHVFNHMAGSKHRYSSKLDYFGRGDFHGLLANRQIYWEGPRIYSPACKADVPSIPLLEQAFSGFIHSRYVEHMLQHKIPRGSDKCYYFLLGYCPISLKEDMAICRTFLPPGYTNTPEGNFWKNLRTKRNLRCQIPSKSDMEAYRSDAWLNKLLWSLDYRVPKWFHDNGYKQAWECDAKLFTQGPSGRRKQRQN